MFRDVHEPIDALVAYLRGAPHPLLRAFRWDGRRYDVRETHLVHREREGETVYLRYSVDSGGDTYFLRLDTEHAEWTLEAVEVSGRRRRGR